MSRKFRGDRLYKVVKILINLVVIFFLIRVGFAIKNELTDYSGKNMKLNADTCKSMLTENPNSTLLPLPCNYYSWKSANEEVLVYSLLLAVTIPIVFYGGTALYKYLFPKEKKEEE